MPTPRFSAHCDVLEDLRRVPPWVRDRALLAVQQLVDAQQRGPLAIPSASAGLGLRVLALDSEGRWRLVYQERCGPSRSTAGSAIHVLCVGPDRDEAVHRIAAARLVHGGERTVDRRAGRVRRRPQAPGPSPSQYAARALSPLPPVVVSAPAYTGRG